MSSDAPLLLLDRVGRSFETAPGLPPLVVLDGVDLCVSSGESVAVTGPSGSGKSTLLNIIGALERPSSGSVLLDGRDLAKLDDNELSVVRNREIGFVFQLHHLLPQCTVLENVLVPTLADATGGSTAEAVERARRLIERVGLTERSHYTPGKLSGGERQRVAVVRALINRPKLLLADEPTGALDGDSADSLAELLVELNREEETALVVVTHSLELAAMMKRRYSLTDCRLIAVEEAT